MSENKIKVTLERYEEVIDLYDSLHLFEVSVGRAFEYLCMFIADENGEYVGAEAGEKYFRENRIKRAQIGELWADFAKKVNEAFVPPTNGAA